MQIYDIKKQRKDLYAPKPGHFEIVEVPPLEFLPANGLAPTGRHHEIYLSDARKTGPARLKTILRQPVST